MVYNGQTLYCVSSYLTTDLRYVPHAEETDLFKTKFAPVNEKVTAKEVTNLRDIPSVLEPSQVVVQLNHGDVAVRTGIANEGWSRVEYLGQVLYCFISYLELVWESYKIRGRPPSFFIFYIYCSEIPFTRSRAMARASVVWAV